MIRDINTAHLACVVSTVSNEQPENLRKFIEISLSSPPTKGSYTDRAGLLEQEELKNELSKQHLSHAIEVQDAVNLRAIARLLSRQSTRQRTRAAPKRATAMRLVMITSKIESLMCSEHCSPIPTTSVANGLRRIWSKM